MSMWCLVFSLVLSADDAALATAAPRKVVSPEGYELERVPAADESIYVLQKRAYTKRNHLEITPMFTALTNSRFVQSFGVWGSLAYHFRESLALEVVGGYSGKPLTRYTDTTVELGQLADVEPLPFDKVFLEWFVGADIQFAPIYGKLRLIPGILGDYDLYVFGGGGVVGTQAPCIPRGNYTGAGLDTDGRDVQGISGQCSADPAQASLKFDLRPAAHFGGGFRIFFTKWFGARIELRDIIYSVLVTRKTMTGTEVWTDIRNNLLFVFGLSFLI
jgi:outer membrane beta-barrel protein